MDELSVEQVERDILRTDSGAFAAVGASTRNMEGTDDMEHLFFKAVGNRLVFHTRLRVVEHALFAGAGRTYIAAGVASDTSRQLVLPEGKAFV